ncbi:unnamed protein product [Ectocarpus sp. 12 AP-2014]
MRTTLLTSLLLLAWLSHQTQGFLVLAASKPPNTTVRGATARAGTSVTMASRSGGEDDVPRALLEHAVAWSATNGLGMVVNDDKGLFTSTHLPFSLLPYALPADSYEQTKVLAPLFNTLVDRISRDGPWLKEVLKDVLAGDDFTSELVRIHETIEAEGGPRQPVCLAINRSDYMLHVPEDGVTAPHLLQVELNTIASSFGCMSALTARLHRHLLSRFGDEPSSAGKAIRDHAASVGIDTTTTTAAGDGGLGELIPQNPTLTALPKALAEAHKCYGKPDAVVLFVVQPGETNAVDQRLLEMNLWDHHGVRVVRMSLAEIEAGGVLGEDGTLTVDGGAVEIAVVYFRAGYAPNDYFGRAEWDARLKLERSTAIKSPSIGYHLAGTKKVQQVLAQEGQVERFLGASESAAVRRCFAGLYSVGPDGDAAATADAVAHPDRYVLKPQREGGGNNLYGPELKSKLDAGGATDDELRSFVLMQRIFPKTQPAVMVNRGKCVSGDSISELGVYGTYLGGGEGKELLNEYAGYLVRTKMEGTDEGGVATGYAVLSSPIVGGRGKAS